jgi:tripartite-type tricarboxylate transporter receptor subunit TctC
MAPPDVPADRLAALRKAFTETMVDPEFLADAEKGKLEITPMNGKELGDLVDRVYRDTTEATAQAAALLVP